MRTFLRTVATLSIAVALVSCMEGPSAPTRLSPARLGTGRVAFQPVFSKSAAEVFDNLTAFNLAYDSVRVVIVRPVADTVADTTVAFRRGSDDLNLDLTVSVVSFDETFGATMQYRGPDGVLFEGKGTVRAHALDAPASQAPRIQIDYVGPGAGVARVEVSPKNVSVSSTGTAAFVAKAYDDAGNVLTSVPLVWRTSDASAATIGPDGSLRGTGRRANLSVSVTSPNGTADFASVALLPSAASIIV